MTGKKLTGAKAAINFAKLAKKPWIHVGAHPSSSKRALRRMAAKAPGGAKQERENEHDSWHLHRHSIERAHS